MRPETRDILEWHQNLEFTPWASTLWHALPNFGPRPKIFGFDVVPRFDEVKVTAVTFDM